jgi:hypothetical protein
MNILLERTHVSASELRVSKTVVHVRVPADAASLAFDRLQLCALGPQIAQLQALTVLNLSYNVFESLPLAIFECASLEQLDVSNNRIAVLPSAIRKLRQLHALSVVGNVLLFLPWDLVELPLTHVKASLVGPPMFFSAAREVTARHLAVMLLARGHLLRAMASRATTICIGLQDLELPAFVTLQIVDAVFEGNSVRMWAKWELITAVKHFHQRHQFSGESGAS